MKPPSWPLSPLSIFLPTGANQKIIEKKADLWDEKKLEAHLTQKIFDLFVLRRLECFSRRKFFFENNFSEIFSFFFQNIFHFSIKTRTQQKILWSIFKLFWSEMIPFSDWQSWMHGAPYFVNYIMCPLFFTIFGFWNYKIRATTVTRTKLRQRIFSFFNCFYPIRESDFLREKIFFWTFYGFHKK